MCRNGVRKAKAETELNLAKNGKNKKGFFREGEQNRQAKESASDKQKGRSGLLRLSEGWSTS